ncbi:hypothetical protein [Streptomyces canus]|uniref:hypothetical protein n=1 Tax=Streptomyces canus TaxID=58343 RepID=UPI0003655994|nr:hypothetical protein [Streptomyces canus]
MSIVRYRKLPVEVDTIEWTGDNLDELTAFTGGLFVPVDPGKGLTSEFTGKVFDALHSTWVLVKTGQRVVCGVLGEFYPIAEDVLAETYELASVERPSPGDAHRAEVLAEADLLPKADVVAWLVKKAREETPVWLLASKVERGAIRPDNLRMLPATFFEAGRTYEYAPLHLLFRCDAVGAHPVTGEPSAVGWVRYHGAGWSSGDYSPAEYADGWTDITDTTTGDNQ